MKCDFVAMSLVCGFLALVILASADQNQESSWSDYLESCDSNDSDNSLKYSSTCRGIRMVKNFARRLVENASRRKDIELFSGVSLVETENAAEITQGRSLGDSVMNFFGNRELKINLPKLLPSNFEAALRNSLPEDNENEVTGRKKGKKDSGLMMVGLMMGKMVAALGFGALGLLTMKALLVGSVALMLSLIMATKKMGGGGGHDNYKTVVYQEPGHRRRRSIDVKNDFGFVPYRPRIEDHGFLLSKLR